MKNIPAFPHVADIVQVDGDAAFVKTLTQNGMTLRDYLAAKAMQTRSWTFYLGDYETRKSLSNTAKNCYEIADAMMKARDA